MLDYSNCVDIFRQFKAIDQYKVKPTFSINSRWVEQASFLVERIAKHDDKVLCQAWDMDSIRWDKAAQAMASQWVLTLMFLIKEFK